MKEQFFLTGKKVYLRPYLLEDLESICKWFNDPLVTYFMFTGQRPKTLEQVRERFEKDVNSEENVIFIAVDKNKNKAIGLVGLYELDHIVRKSEMRIIIGESDYWGEGYGTEMTNLIDFYGFDRLNLNRIYLGVTSENKGAIRTYEKAGYVYEGTLKQDIYRNSLYYDSLRMGLLRDDYYKKFYSTHKIQFSGNIKILSNSKKK